MILKVKQVMPQNVRTTFHYSPLVSLDILLRPEPLEYSTQGNKQTERKMCPIYDSETLFSEAAWSAALIQPTKLNRWLPRQRWPGEWVGASSLTLRENTHVTQRWPPHTSRAETILMRRHVLLPSMLFLVVRASFSPLKVVLTGEGPVLVP